MPGLDWTDLIETFSHDVAAHVRQQPVAERLNLIDDLNTAMETLRAQLIGREIALLAGEGYSKSRIANALGVNVRLVTQIAAEQGIETTSTAHQRPKAHDLREEFSRIDSALALQDEGYRS